MAQTDAAAVERIKRGFRALRTAQTREDIKQALRQIGLPKDQFPKWLKPRRQDVHAEVRSLPPKAGARRLT